MLTLLAFLLVGIALGQRYRVWILFPVAAVAIAIIATLFTRHHAGPLLVLLAVAMLQIGYAIGATIRIAIDDWIARRARRMRAARLEAAE